METVFEALSQTARCWLPRLLTQACRDTTSPHQGSFDRDWWHYRIRDFSSIILQQGGYAIYLASQRSENQRGRAEMQNLAAAAGRFWNHRATRPGAFEEYYPWEQGYPPLAFSTLAVMKLAAAGVLPPAELRTGATVAAGQLRARFESQAANQQVAGLAGLAWCRKNYPELVPADQFEALVQKSLALQTGEGWFEEYGGPDLGYLSVTMDCLWDLFDATGDQRFLTALERSLACIQRFAIFPAGTIGMHNSRNTDYLVPYGLVRLALHNPEPATLALVHRLFANAASPEHFFGAVDDRYVSHYIGQSLFRAVLLLEQCPQKPAIPPLPAPSAGEATTASGHFIRQTAAGHNTLVTLRKGGILSHHAGVACLHDFGWVIKANSTLHITHWWSDVWQHGRTGQQVWVAGTLFQHREVANTPARHLALRLASRIAGNRLIARLKNKLIFAKAPSPIQFRRTIEWQGDEIRVVDVFSQVPVTAEFLPAPRSSKRHVASADSFHPQDVQLTAGYALDRKFNRSAGGMEIISTYRPLV